MDNKKRIITTIVFIIYLLSITPLFAVNANNVYYNNENGAIVEQKNYEKFSYRGSLLFLDFGARYLDPKYSRWLSTDPALGDYIPQAPVNDEARKANGNLPGQGGLFNQVNFHLYHYAGNNPVKYVDPDGEDIRESELYSFSVGAGISARISLGIAKDSNHRSAIYMKLETGIGVGGSIANTDTIIESLDTITSIFQNTVNGLDSIKTLDDIVLDTGKKNFEGSITHQKETIFTWKQERKTIPVESAFIVGVNGDKKGNTKITLGATAIASVYLHEDTWYFDITKEINSIKSFVNNIEKE